MLYALLLATALWTPRSPSSDVIETLNDMRRQEGVGPVVVDGTLTTIAAHQAQTQLACGRVSHFSCNGKRGVGDRIRVCAGLSSAAENVGSCASALTGTDMLSLWNASAPHRQNMLGSRYQAGGAGRACGGTTCYWALVLAAPKDPCYTLSISSALPVSLSAIACLFGALTMCCTI